MHVCIFPIYQTLIEHFEYFEVVHFLKRASLSNSFENSMMNNQEKITSYERCRVEKSGEHSRPSPGTRNARNCPKGVWIAFQAICSVKIA